MKKVALILLFVLAMQGFADNSSSALAKEDIEFQDAVWGSSSLPVEVGPGDTSAPLSFVLINTTPEPLGALRGWLDLPSGFRYSKNSTMSRAFASYPSSVSAGSSFSLDFLIDLGANVNVTTYTSRLEIEYTELLSQGRRSLTLDVSFRVPGRSVLKASLGDVVLTPGVENDLSLTIVNEGTARASSLDIDLTLPHQAPSSTLFTFTGYAGDWPVGDIDPRGRVELNFTLFVSQSAAGGAYLLPLTITYRNSYGRSQSLTRSLGIRVSSLTPEPISASLQSPELMPGSSNDLVLSIRNGGEDTMYSLDAALSLPQGATAPLIFLDTDGHWSIDMLKGGERVDIAFKAYASISSANGAFLLPLTVTYRDAQGFSRSATRMIGVRVTASTPKEASLDVTVEEPTLTPGADNVVALLVRNDGSGPALSLELDLDLTSLPSAPLAFVDSDGHWSVDGLDGGREVKLTFRVYASLSSANSAYQLPLSMSYMDRYGNSYLASRTLGVRVRSLEVERLSLATSLEDPIMAPGRSTKALIKIVNNGSMSAFSLEVSLSPPQGSPITLVGTDGHWIISKLAPREEVTIDLPIYVSPNAPSGAYQLPLTITYRDSYGNAQTLSRPLGAIVSPAQERSGITITASSFLTAGIISDLELELGNDAQNHISDLSFAISPASSSVTLLGRDRWAFPLLAPGEKVSVKVPLFVAGSASDNAISLRIDLQYASVGDVIITESRNIGVYVQGLVKISSYDVSYTYVGSTPSLIGNVLNEGNTPALFTNIYAIPPKDGPILSASSAYLGDLNPDAPLPFTLTLQVRNVSRPTPTNVTLVVTYKDSLRDEHAKTFDITLIVPPPEQRQTRETLTLQPGYVIGIAAVIIVLSLYLVRRRRARHAS